MNPIDNLKGRRKRGVQRPGRIAAPSYAPAPMPSMDDDTGGEMGPQMTPPPVPKPLRAKRARRRPPYGT